MYRLFIIFALACASIAVSKAQTPPDSVGSPQSVGLVLSGGGAKGIAHIGVIQALEDNDIPIDYISGTSMGSIVGSLYACGFTPGEMMELIGSRAFSYWSTGRIDERWSYFFLRPEPSPAMLTLNLGKDGAGMSTLMPSSLINPMPMDFAFMELYAPFTAQCHSDFNRLFVPFRSVASNVTLKRKQVLASGSLGDAVRASMSFPLVFQPIRINGDLMYDGGIYDNFPVDVMRDTFAPQFMIGIDVSSTDVGDDNTGMVSQLENLIIQNTDTTLSAQQGIKIRIHLDQFGLLDFAKAKEIYAIGYAKAVQMMDSIKGRVYARVPAEARRLRRQVFKSQTPSLRFDSVAVGGVNNSQAAFIRHIFTGYRSDTLGLPQVRDSYYQAITSGKLKELNISAAYNDTTRLFRLDLVAKEKNDASLAVGGYLTTSINSMLYLSGAYRTLNFNSLSLQLSGWVGQSYLAAEAKAQVRILRSTPTALQLHFVAQRSKYKQIDRFFFQSDEPTYLTTDEYFARLSYGIAAGRCGKADVSVGVARIADDIYPLAIAREESATERSRQNLAQARMSAEFSTLDSYFAPTAGSHIKAHVMGVTGQLYHTPSDAPRHYRQRFHQLWWQAAIAAEHYFNLSSRLSLGLGADILLSNRRLLPTLSLSLARAPLFEPSFTISGLFSPNFRANSYGALAVKPIVKLSSMLQLRGQVDMFLPYRPIVEGDVPGSAAYGRRFSRAEFFGQIEALLTLPFANLSAYTHYSTAARGKWNFGLTFGFYLRAPGFLR